MNITDTSSDNVCGSKRQLFTTRYTYGSQDQEYVFSCRGRPFVALVSPNYPTPTSSLFDYDLIKSLGLKLTDLQCKKFFFAGNKFRILGRVSTTVQCIQNGRSTSNFHLKGLVISDLNKILDTHCVAGTKMKQQLNDLCSETDDPPDDDDLTDDLDNDQFHHGPGEDIDERNSETKGKVNSKSAKRKSESKAHNITKKPSFKRADDDPAAEDVGQSDGVCQRHHVLQDGHSDAESNSSSPGVKVGSISSHLASQLHPDLKLSTGAGEAFLLTQDMADYWVRVISSAPKVMPPISPEIEKYGGGYSSAPRTNMPPGTCPRPTSLYSIGHNLSDTHDSYRTKLTLDSYNFWSQYAKSSEGNIIRMSCIDGKPRVVNVDVEDGKDDMLRVGDWTKLEDPTSHQARHVLIASLRRAAPDRVCQACSYMLQHSCPLPTNTKHCAQCCDDVKLKTEFVLQNQALHKERMKLN